MKNILMIFVLLGGLAACTKKSDEPSPASDPQATLATTTEEKTDSGKCVRTGCSGTSCENAPGDGSLGTCEWQPAYACYKLMSCQPNEAGQCAFVGNDESDKCFKNPPKD